MNEDELVVPAEEKVEVPPKEEPEEETVETSLVLVARNPNEMQKAQAGLREWAEKKVIEVRESYEDLKQNYEVSVKNKWKTSALKRLTLLAKQKLEYYEKAKAAIDEGYCLVPNFPMDVFAIRTSQTKPPKFKRETNPELSWDTTPNPATVATDSPPPGEGRYVGDVTTDSHNVVAVPQKDDTKKLVRKTEAISFSSIEFPMIATKPILLDATSQAMALKIFDEIGILPARKGHFLGNRRTPAGRDPMIVGRIVRKIGYQEHAMSFLIAWFVDTREL